MADAQVLYAEDISGTTAASTAWMDTAIISAASFTANARYLIIAHIISTFSTSNGEARSRLVHGTTPTVFDDASLAHEGVANTQEHEQFWLFDYTQPVTTELVKIQISSSGTATQTCRIAQILAINLDDMGASGTDYFWDEDLTDYTMTATPTAKATTTSFTPNGTDRWLFIGHMIEDVVGITTPIGFELYDSVAGILNSCQFEGEDGTNDFRGVNLYWAGVPTNAARTLAVRPFDSGSGVMLASRVIAINLAKFAQSASAFNAAEVDPATTPTYTTLATVSPTPTNTGNWVYLGFSNQDVNQTTTDWETRIQVNADGGGLVSDPAYPTTAPSIDNWDATDETPHAIFNLVTLTSGAARDINWDCRRVAGTTGRMEDNGLVAFSVALAGAQTVTLLSRALRVNSEITTPSFIFPVDQKAGQVYIRTDMLETDLHSIGKSGSLAIEISSDDGETWQFYASMTWESNVTLRNGVLVGNPAIGIPDAQVWAGKMIRARATFDGVTTGFVLEIP